MQIWRMKPDGTQPGAGHERRVQQLVPAHLAGRPVDRLHQLPEGRRSRPTTRTTSASTCALMPVAGGTPRVIAYVYGGQGTINVPSWSPDSRMLAFVSNTGPYLTTRTGRERCTATERSAQHPARNSTEVLTSRGGSRNVPGCRVAHVSGKGLPARDPPKHSRRRAAPMVPIRALTAGGAMRRRSSGVRLLPLSPHDASVRTVSPVTLAAGGPHGRDDDPRHVGAGAERRSSEKRRRRRRSASRSRAEAYGSATFGLGFLRGLSRLRLLTAFDYLSTVSGGGYIGCWLSAWIHRHPDGFAGVMEELAAGSGVDDDAAQHEPAPVHHLRRFSNYLAPRVGLLSATRGRSWRRFCATC